MLQVEPCGVIVREDMVVNLRVIEGEIIDHEMKKTSERLHDRCIDYAEMWSRAVAEGRNIIGFAYGLVDS